MSKPIQFTFYGPPKPQGRHRSVAIKGKGRGIRQYDPSASHKQSFVEAIQEYRPEKPLDVPLAVKIDFYFQRPKSHYGTKKGVPYLKPESPNMVSTKGRNDIDNLFKLVTDAMNGVFYTDDGLIAVAVASKRYSDVARTEVVIRRLDPRERREINFNKTVDRVTGSE